MGDADSTSTEHLWRLQGVTFGEGTFTEYVCELCGALLLVPPGGIHPAEA